MTSCVNMILWSRICCVQEGCQYLWGFQYRESKGVTRSKNDEWRRSFSLNTLFGSIWSAADEIEIDSASPTVEFSIRTYYSIFQESRLDLASLGLEIRMTLASAITHFQQQTPAMQNSNKASPMQFIGDFRLRWSGGGWTSMMAWGLRESEVAPAPTDDSWNILNGI